MKDMKELPYTRQQQILERLNKSDCVKINQLAKDFNVSQMTIYRDIVQLEKSGEALRVYGGVKAANKVVADIPEDEEDMTPQKVEIPAVLQPYSDVTIEERFQHETEAKRTIARVAASYVKDGDIIAIDPSTTTLHMCSYLQNRKIIVVTTSIHVALQFASSKSVDVIMVGGLIRKSALSVVGTLVPNVLDQLCINKCFLSSHAFTYDHGLTDRTMEECDSKRQLIKKSDEVYMLLDHSKIGKHAPFVVCNVKDMDMIITDVATQKSDEGKAIMKQCMDAGCKVVFAKEKQNSKENTKKE